MRKSGLAILPTFSFMLGAVLAAAAEVTNITGLPAYPNLQSAKMEERTRTVRLGRQCAHFTATTFDPLLVVETWYRKNLAGASETDLVDDENYSNPSKVIGIKLVVGIDYVTIYRVPNQSLTAIELYRCSPRS